MNHTTIPVSAQGEPIPLIKLGQGREEEPQTFAAKLRAAGYQEPALPNPHALGAVQMHANKPPMALDDTPAPSIPDLPLVSQRGFKAGVFATCLGGAFLAALYLGAGALICGCVASGCVGFVAGMLLTEDWK